MIIDPELRKALRETLRAKKREYHSYNPHKEEREAVQKLLAENKPLSGLVKALLKDIAALDKQREAKCQAIQRLGLTRDARSVFNKAKFVKHGGVLASKEPQEVPGFDTVIAQLTAATSQIQADVILKNLGIHWQPVAA